MNSSSSLVVPPPLGSAPPPSTAALSPQHHKPVRASLSSLSSSQMSSGEAANMVISNSNPGLMDESWYRSNKIATAKTLQLQRQLSAGSFKTAGGTNFFFLSY